MDFEFLVEDVCSKAHLETRHIEDLELRRRAMIDYGKTLDKYDLEDVVAQEVKEIEEDKLKWE